MIILDIYQCVFTFKYNYVLETNEIINNHMFRVNSSVGKFIDEFTLKCDEFTLKHAIFNYRLIRNSWRFLNPISCCSLINLVYCSH